MVFKALHVRGVTAGLGEKDSGLAMALQGSGPAGSIVDLVRQERADKFFPSQHNSSWPSPGCQWGSQAQLICLSTC